MSTKQAHPLLYINDANTVALIDIPTSIAHAQSTTHYPFEFDLLSNLPPERPYSGNEPKSKAAQERLRDQNLPLPEDEDYKKLINVSLTEISDHFQGDWCLPRRISSGEQLEINGSGSERSLKRKRDESDHGGAPKDGKSKNTRVPPIDRVPGNNRSFGRTESAKSTPSAEKGLPSLDLGRWEVCDAEPRVFGLNLKGQRRSSASLNLSSPPVEFFCPPRASFIMANCKDTDYLKTHYKRMIEYQHRQVRGTNIMLLDPPWPNRSARRKKGSSSYETFEDLRDLKSMLRDLKLNDYLKQDGYVAVWITNKAKVRSAVLSNGGLFRRLNVVLHEEWIWVKTTVKGEPVTKLDGLWRKPYEVLLVGKQRPHYVPVPVKRRVIAGVPDLHSRKPCLKSLVERWLGFEPGNYYALEIFARHLVTGWDSWGLDTLKFQVTENWVPRNEEHQESRLNRNKID